MVVSETTHIPQRFQGPALQAIADPPCCGAAPSLSQTAAVTLAASARVLIQNRFIAADFHSGRRTALTFPLLPPPQKNRSWPSNSSPDTPTPAGICTLSKTSPVAGSTRNRARWDSSAGFIRKARTISISLGTSTGHASPNARASANNAGRRVSDTDEPPACRGCARHFRPRR